MKKFFLAILVCALVFDISMAQMNRNPSQLPLVGDQAMLEVNDDLGDLSRRRRVTTVENKLNGTFQFIGGSLASPSGDLGEASESGSGFDLSAVYFFDNFGVGMISGMTTFKQKGDAGSTEGFLERPGFIPMMVQALYAIGEEDISPYIGFAAGFYIPMSFDTDAIPFGYAPQAGVIYSVSDKFHLYFNARYNVVTLDVNKPFDPFAGFETEKFTCNYLNFSLGIAFPYATITY